MSAHTKLSSSFSGEIVLSRPLEEHCVHSQKITSAIMVELLLHFTQLGHKLAQLICVLFSLMHCKWDWRPEM